jgi:hypothetical protein
MDTKVSEERTVHIYSTDVPRKPPKPLLPGTKLSAYTLQTSAAPTAGTQCQSARIYTPDVKQPLPLEVRTMVSTFTLQL